MPPGRLQLTFQLEMQAVGLTSPTQVQAEVAGSTPETVATSAGGQKPVLPVTESILQHRTYFLPLLVSASSPLACGAALPFIQVCARKIWGLCLAGHRRGKLCSALSNYQWLTIYSAPLVLISTHLLVMWRSQQQFCQRRHCVSQFSNNADRALQFQLPLIASSTGPHICTLQITL